MQTTEELLAEAMALLEESRALGLTFYPGSAYISKAYIEHQTDLKTRIRDLQSRVEV